MLVGFYLLYDFVVIGDADDPITEIEDLKKQIEQRVEYEQRQHEQVVRIITEVKTSVTKEVRALDSNDVAISLNDELRLFRDQSNSAGLDGSNAGVLHGRAGRARPISGDERIPVRIPGLASGVRRSQD
jgi:hypothetical protein